MPKTVVITGGCGFIGHHFVEHVLRNTDWLIVVLDKLTYASNGFDRLRDIAAFDDTRVTVLTADLSQAISSGVLKEIGVADYIVHMAAETHVDRAIEDPEPFVLSNVLGTMHVLNLAKKLSVEKFIYFSTDEVFGPAPPGVSYKEWDSYHSTNPYSATKAGGEELCLAYENTYKVPVLIVHCMNAFGQRQHPEKFIPKTIRYVLDQDVLEIHADNTKTKPGSRFYIHARNIADAVLFLIQYGEIGQKYNISGEREIDNLEMAKMIAGIIGKPLRYELTDWHSSRPGHDLRYALDDGEIKAIGWKQTKTFDESLTTTVEWFLNNSRWLVSARGAGR